MLRRVIPCLLFKDSGLVKTTKFKDPRYLGDPINIIKIFNEKEVDELVLLDIDATQEGRKPNFEFLSVIASECFMPLGYGGGIKELSDITKIFEVGIEKVILNTQAICNPTVVQEAAHRFGSQSIVVSIDVRKSLFGKYEVYSHGGKIRTGLTPLEHAQHMEQLGAGEIIINSIDQDGVMNGYDIALLKKISSSVSVPVVALGGAGAMQDLVKAIEEGGASAVAAGSMFVFQGKHRAVLVNYPSEKELEIINTI